jgi:hypothetical protein
MLGKINQLERIIVIIMSLILIITIYWPYKPDCYYLNHKFQILWLIIDIQTNYKKWNLQSVYN